MTRSLQTSGILLLCLALGAPAHAAKPRVELKIATVAPEGSTWMKVMRDIDAQVRKQTGNHVGFKIYAGGVQGDDSVVLRKTRIGQLHGGGLTGLGLGMIAPETRVVELPFLFDTYEEIDTVYESIGARLEAALNDRGFTLLGWAEVGFVYLFSKNPIATHADLKKSKMWLWEGDPLAADFYEVAGIAPVPLSISDVMTSLQTRLIDAVYCSPLACLALQWFTRVSYYTDIPLTFASGAVVVSKKAFDKIPAEHQTTIGAICRAEFRKLVEKSRQQNAEALLEIEKAGVKRVGVAASELERFRGLGQRVQEREVGKLYSRELLEAVHALLDH